MTIDITADAFIARVKDLVTDVQFRYLLKESAEDYRYINLVKLPDEHPPEHGPLAWKSCGRRFSAPIWTDPVLVELGAALKEYLIAAFAVDQQVNRWYETFPRRSRPSHEEARSRTDAGLATIPTDRLIAAWQAYLSRRAALMALAAQNYTPEMETSHKWRE